MDKKRLYLNGCSFLYNGQSFLLKENPLYKIFNETNHSNKDLTSYNASAPGSDNESIFRRTLIDCCKNNFDFAIIAWTHPERTLSLYPDLKIDLEKIKKDSESNFFGDDSMYKKLYGYLTLLPSDKHDVYSYSKLKFEPKATDDTIFYTIALHHFFKSKNIPHLFLNMGKLDSNILSARENWINEINPQNYLSLNNNDTILQKMQFSFTEYYAKKVSKPIVKDIDINSFKSLEGNSDDEYELAGNGWIRDVGGHLGYLAFYDLFQLMYNHIKIHFNLV